MLRFAQQVIGDQPPRRRGIVRNPRVSGEIPGRFLIISGREDALIKQNFLRFSGGDGFAAEVGKIFAVQQLRQMIQITRTDPSLYL